MAKSRRRNGKPAVDCGEFDPFGLRLRTLREEVAGGDLDSAFNAASNISTCLEVIQNEATGIRTGYEEFAEQQTKLDAAEGEGDEQCAHSAAHYIDEWERYLHKRGPGGHEDDLRVFAWRVVAYCSHYNRTNPASHIWPVEGALAATRSLPVEILGYRSNSMTLALIRIFDYLCQLVLGTQGAEALEDVWLARTAGLSVEAADGRISEFIADPAAVVAFSGIRIPQLVADIYDFLRELIMIEVEQEMEREFYRAWTFRIDNRLPLPKPPPAAGTGNGMAREEADRKARELARDDPSFYTASGREQARRIGCSYATWHATPFYEQARWRRKGPARPKRTGEVAAPKAVSFTKEMESVTGEGRQDEVLHQLTKAEEAEELRRQIASQQAENEPSPLDPDPADARPTRVRGRKRA
ncbi:MAG TPA: hypothetical protein VMS17_14850 [Gemmataceae bacterium]|nr:hypothetical protein [Gemmataceae bacterium]